MAEVWLFTAVEICVLGGGGDGWVRVGGDGRRRGTLKTMNETLICFVEMSFYKS